MTERVRRSGAHLADLGVRRGGSVRAGSGPGPGRVAKVAAAGLPNGDGAAPEVEAAPRGSFAQPKRLNAFQPPPTRTRALNVAVPDVPVPLYSHSTPELSRASRSGLPSPVVSPAVARAL